jgi:hypothetical protein
MFTFLAIPTDTATKKLIYLLDYILHIHIIMLQ